MNKIFDLRFVIGLFFLVVGILLLIYSFVTSTSADAQSINRWCSIVFIIFGVSMILLSMRKDADDEIVE